MSNSKERAFEIYRQHLALASTDGRLFRKTVMDQIIAETGCSLASAATHYNNAKKAIPVEGLGRAPAPVGLKKPGSSKVKKQQEVIPDDECFSVLELVKSGTVYTVGRCQSFEIQGDASEKFDEKVGYRPELTWVLIKGLGPNSGDTYKLDTGEKELKRHEPASK